MKEKIKNLVLTGGGSQLEGIADYAQIIFDSNVRFGLPHSIFGTGKFYKEQLGEKKENIYSNIDDMLSKTLESDED